MPASRARICALLGSRREEAADRGPLGQACEEAVAARLIDVDLLRDAAGTRMIGQGDVHRTRRSASSAACVRRRRAPGCTAGRRALAAEGRPLAARHRVRCAPSARAASMLREVGYSLPSLWRTPPQARPASSRAPTRKSWWTSCCTERTKKRIHHQHGATRRAQRCVDHVAARPGTSLACTARSSCGQHRRSRGCRRGWRRARIGHSFRAALHPAFQDGSTGWEQGIKMNLYFSDIFA